MLNEVLLLTDNLNLYLKKANERAAKEDYVSALAFCFSALSLSRTPEVYKTLAEIYSDMGLYELSNKYWYFYLDKTPEKQSGNAYEELGINFFYMGNTMLANYYFNKKVKVDGFISEDGIDKEILDYFAEEPAEKAFRLVYPPELADYSDKLDSAKRSMACNDFAGAIQTLSEVPEGVKDYDKIADNLSLAYFLSGDIEKAIAINKRRVELDGNKLEIYCNLTSMYNALKNEDKRNYYFALARSEQPKGIDEEYRLAMACLENKDDEAGLRLLEKVIKERPFDLETEYLLALAKINSGKYEEAEKNLKNLLKIDPYDYLWKYYYKLVKDLMNGDEKAKTYLPVSYEMDVPHAVRAEWVEKVKKSALNQFEGKQGKRRPKGMMEIFDWGIRNYSGNEVFANACIFSLGSDLNRSTEKYLKEKLIDDDVSLNAKMIMLYMLLMKGTAEKISLVESGVFVKIKPVKINFGEDEKGLEFQSAYALCTAKLVILGLHETGKIAKSAKRVTAMLRGIQTDANEGEIAALIFDGCGFPFFKHLGEICSLFNVDEKRVAQIKNLMLGGKNDKGC